MPDLETFIPLLLVLLVALTFHEFAHAWVAYKLGDDTAYRDGRVTLNPIVHLDLWGSICFLVTQGFGWAKPVPVNPTHFSKPRRDDILVTAAGPFSNLLLALLSGAIYFTMVKKGMFAGYQQVPTLKLAHHFLFYMVTINLVLMMFNLIPLFPLDGSHIVTNLLPLNQAYNFKQFNESYGPGILIGLVALGMITQGKLNPLHWIIMPPVTWMTQGIRDLVWMLV